MELETTGLDGAREETGFAPEGVEPVSDAGGTAGADMEEAREEQPEDEGLAVDMEVALRQDVVRALVEAAREQGRRELLCAMRARGTRPLPLDAQGGLVGADFHSMSDASLRAIDERLKRGERVRV